jgi:glutamate-1-semialdehyde 2,1-aminomutase
MKLDRSKSVFEAAQKLIPGGVNSPVRAYRSVGGTPVHVARGKGAHVTDLDGNEYIDLVMSYGPLILGHADARVSSALARALESGTSFGAPTEGELELARIITSRVKPVEMVRLVNSGTEATMSALRLARAATGRDLVIKFNGCYHGHGDSFLVKAGSGALTFGAPDSPGVPRALAELTLVAEYNDLESARALFEKHSPSSSRSIRGDVASTTTSNASAAGTSSGSTSPAAERRRVGAPSSSRDAIASSTRSHETLAGTSGANTGNEIAAVIVEPVAGNMGCVLPEKGFLEGLRALCTKQGALLIFDEVMTGFRVARGGYQELCGVIPDLVTLGKVIGGGLPIGAYGGRADLMSRVSPAGDVYQAGTLSGNPLAVAAGIATLRATDEKGFYSELEERSAQLQLGLERAARDAKVPIWIGRQGSMLCPYLSSEPVTSFDNVMKSDRERWKRFFHAMLERGVLLPPSPFEAWFVSSAHDADTIERIVGAARGSLAAS